jgi:hypothetical protein
MNSIHRPGLNRARAAAQSEAAASVADVMDTIATMLQGAHYFAEQALKEELEGGEHGDEAGEVVDAISDAIGKPRNVEGNLSS